MGTSFPRRSILVRNWDKNLQIFTAFYIHRHPHLQILLPHMVFLDLKYLQQPIMGGELACFHYVLVFFEVALFFLLFHLIKT